MDDPGLFAPWFAGASWDGWRAVLKAAFALPMSEEERALFRTLADREPPSKQVRELWVIAGRRAGKDSIASLIAAHCAALFDQQHRLGQRLLDLADRQSDESGGIAGIGIGDPFGQVAPKLLHLRFHQIAGPQRIGPRRQ